MMTEIERQAILTANRQLLERRKAFKPGPQPINRAIPALVEASGQTEADRAYFEAVRSLPRSQALELVGNAQEITTNRALWDSFDSDRHPALQKAVKLIKAWYNERIPGGGLILAGSYGCGKTHLAQAIHQLYGPGAIYWNEVRLVEVIRGGYGGGGRSEESIYANVRRAGLLVYDDLGAYQTANLEWIQGVYYKLFDGRHEAGLATFITTNLPLKASYGTPFEDRIGGRVFSRLMGQLGHRDYFINLFKVPDYRKRNF